MRTDDTQATLPELSDEVGAGPGQPLSSVSPRDGGSTDHAADSSLGVEITLVVSGEHLASLMRGSVTTEVQNACISGVIALSTPAADAVKRKRKVAA